MTKPKEQIAAQEHKPSPLEEAHRVIVEYAANLREIIRKLRQKMN
ncbi:hypothetical protein ABIB94_002775 [Bradyrhizobium sp. JR7.2]